MTRPVHERARSWIERQLFTQKILGQEDYFPELEDIFEAGADAVADLILEYLTNTDPYEELGFADAWGWRICADKVRDKIKGFLEKRDDDKQQS